MQQSAQSRRLRRPLAVLSLILAFLVFGAGTAAAHITVIPDTAAPGSFTTLSFRVPNESDTASTVRVEIQLTGSAEDPVFALVLAEQMPGWTSEVITAAPPAPIELGEFTLDEVATSVVFTTGGDGIGPGQFATFDVLVGPVPELPSLLLPAFQTYSDGEVVAWDQETPPSGVEPERPAPVLAIEGEGAGHGHGAEEDRAHADDAAGSAGVTGTTDPQTAAGGAAGSDGLARILAIIALLIGVVGVAIGVSGRRSTATAAVTGSATSPFAGFPGMTAPGEPRQPDPPDAPSGNDSGNTR